MKYFRVQIEFTVPDSLIVPAEKQLDLLLDKIRGKRELTYVQNINIAIAKETIDPPIKKGHSQRS